MLVELLCSNISAEMKERAKDTTGARGSFQFFHPIFFSEIARKQQTK
jgi:hypothetical protein